MEISAIFSGAFYVCGYLVYYSLICGAIELALDINRELTEENHHGR